MDSRKPPPRPAICAKGLGLSRWSRSAILLGAAALLATGPVIPTTAISADGDVATVPAFVVPADTWFGEQWYLFAWGQTVGGTVQVQQDVDVRAPEAWSVTKGDPAVVVAVVDTGADVDHPDLVANIWQNPGETGDGREGNGVDDDGNGFVDDWRGWDFVDDDNLPEDARGEGVGGELPVAHGTSLAGIIAADDNGWGMVGLAPDATVMVLRSPIHGLGLADAVRYAIEGGARIVNLSFGNAIPYADAEYEPLHQVMIEHPEVLFVAAAMNSSWDQDTFHGRPCTYDDVAALLCVAAIDHTQGLATFYAGGSGYGRTTVDLAAPGDDMLVPQPPAGIAFSDDFATDLRAWTVTGAGTWQTVPSGFDGAGAAGSVDAGQTAYLETAAPVDAAGGRDCWLTGRVLGRPGDARFAVEFANATIPGLWFSSSALARYGPLGAAGTDWARFDIPVPDVAISGAGDTRFRLKVSPGPGSASAGVVVDDIALTCQGLTGHTERDFAYAEGTSYAAPLTAAAAALVWSADLSLTAADVRASVLDGVQPVPALDGRVASGGRLDAYGALISAGQAGGLTSEPVLPRSPQAVPTSRARPAPGEPLNDSAPEPRSAAPWIALIAALAVAAGVTTTRFVRRHASGRQRAELDAAINAAERARAEEQKIVENAARSREETRLLAERALAASQGAPTSEREAGRQPTPGVSSADDALHPPVETRHAEDEGAAISVVKEVVKEASGPPGDVIGWYEDFGERLATKAAERERQREAAISTRAEQLAPTVGGNESLARDVAESEASRRALPEALERIGDVVQAGAEATADVVAGEATKKIAADRIRKGLQP